MPVEGFLASRVLRSATLCVSVCSAVIEAGEPSAVTGSVPSRWRRRARYSAPGLSRSVNPSTRACRSLARLMACSSSRSLGGVSADTGPEGCSRRESEGRFSCLTPTTAAPRMASTQHATTERFMGAPRVGRCPQCQVMPRASQGVVRRRPTSRRSHIRTGPRMLQFLAVLAPLSSTGGSSAASLPRQSCSLRQREPPTMTPTGIRPAA